MFWLVIHTSGIESAWPTWSQDNGLDLDIRANAWGDVSVSQHSKDCLQVGLA